MNIGQLTKLNTSSLLTAETQALAKLPIPRSSRQINADSLKWLDELGSSMSERIIDSIENGSLSELPSLGTNIFGIPAFTEGGETHRPVLSFQPGQDQDLNLAYVDMHMPNGKLQRWATAPGSGAPDSPLASAHHPQSDSSPPLLPRRPGVGSTLTSMGVALSKVHKVYNTAALPDRNLTVKTLPSTPPALPLQRPVGNESADEARGTSDLLSAFNLEKNNLLTRLFPNGIQNSNFNQGNIGDCVFLAALKSTCVNDPKEIYKIINPGKSPGTVNIKFHGEKTVVLHEQDFKKMGVQGDLGVQMLERAYGLTKKRFLGQSARKQLTGLNMKPVFQALNSNKRIISIKAPMERIKEPWREWRKLISLNFEQKPLSQGKQKKIEELLIRLEKNPKDHIMAISTRSTSSEDRSQLPVIGFNRDHAYALISANSKDREVVLSNPWATGNPIKISYDELFANFSNFKITEPLD